MRKLLLVVSLLVATMFPVFAFSATGSAIPSDELVPICKDNAKNTNVCRSVKSQDDNGSNPIIRIIKAAINIVSYIAGIAAIILIVISAMRFVTSGGDSNNVAGARRGLVYALIGIMVVIISQVLVAYVLKGVK